MRLPELVQVRLTFSNLLFHLMFRDWWHDKLHLFAVHYLVDDVSDDIRIAVSLELHLNDVGDWIPAYFADTGEASLIAASEEVNLRPTSVDLFSLFNHSITSWSREIQKSIRLSPSGSTFSQLIRALPP